MRRGLVEAEIDRVPEDLAAWRSFLLETVETIANLPSVGLLQLALMRPPGSPVHQAARRYLDTRGPPAVSWLRYVLGPAHAQSTPRCTFRGHETPITGLAVSGDGRLVVSGSAGRDNTVRVWDLDTGACLRVLRHPTEVNDVAIDSSGRFVAAGGFSESIVAVWDLETGKRRSKIDTRRDRAFVRFVPGRADALVVADGTLQRWSLERRARRVWKAEPDRAADAHPLLFIDCDADRVVCLEVSYADGAVHLRTHAMETGALVARVALDVRLDPEESAGTLRLSPDGTTVAWASWLERPGRIDLFDVRTGGRVRSLAGPAEGVTGLAFVDGSIVATGADHTLRRWSLDAGEPTGALIAHADRANAVAVVPHTTRVVTGGSDGVVALWDLAHDLGPLAHDLGPPDRLPPRPPTVGQLETLPDGSLLLRTGAELRRLEPATVEIPRPWPDALPRRQAAGFVTSPDAARLVVAQYASPDPSVMGDGEIAVSIWDAETGERRAVATIAGRLVDVAWVDERAFVVTDFLWPDPAAATPLACVDPVDGSVRRTGPWSAAELHAVRAARVGDRLCVATHDRRIRVITGGGEVVGVLEAAGPIHGLHAHPDAVHLLSATPDTLEVWNLGDLRRIEAFPLTPGRMSPSTTVPVHLAILDDPLTFVASAQAPRVELFRPGTEGRWAVAPSGDRFVTRLRASPDRHLLLGTADDRSVTIWDADGTVVAAWRLDTEARDAAWLGDRHLAILDAAHRLHLLELVRP